MQYYSCLAIASSGSLRNDDAEERRFPVIHEERLRFPIKGIAREGDADILLNLTEPLRQKLRNDCGLRIIQFLKIEFLECTPAENAAPLEFLLLLHLETDVRILREDLDFLPAFRLPVEHIFMEHVRKREDIWLAVLAASEVPEDFRSEQMIHFRV